MESVNTMLFAVVFPVFVTDEVNVIVSPIVAKVVLAFLFKTKVASIIGVTVVFVIVLRAAGDWFDSRCIHNLQEHYLLMCH